MAPDDEEVDDLYDDEFDFVDDDDEGEDEEDDDSDLDDDSELDSAVEDSAVEGSAVEDSEVEDSAIEVDVAKDNTDSELDDKPAPRAAVAKRETRDANHNGAEGAERDGQRDADGEGDDEPVDDYSRPAPAANHRVHIYEYRQFKRTIDRPFTPEDAEAFASEFNRTSKSYGRFALTGKDDAKPRKALE